MYSIYSTFTLFLRSILGLLLLLSSSSTIYSQESFSYKLGHLEEVVKPFVEPHFKLTKNQKINLQVTAQKSFTISIQSNDCKEGDYYLFGKVEGFQNATFFIKGDNNGIKGKLLFYDDNEAYLISTNKLKEVFIEKVNIHSQVCIIENTASILKIEKENSRPIRNSKKEAMPELESFPGASGVLYLDFDGENVSGVLGYH